MGIFSGAPQMPTPQMPAPPPPPPTPVDPGVMNNLRADKMRRASSAGYAGTIATGGQGDPSPAFTTANFGKTLLGT